MTEFVIHQKPFLAETLCTRSRSSPTTVPLTQNIASGSNSQSPYSNLITNSFLFLGFGNPGSPKLHKHFLLLSVEQQTFQHNYHNSSNKRGLSISRSSWQCRVYTLHNRITLTTEHFYTAPLCNRTKHYMPPHCD